MTFSHITTMTVNLLLHKKRSTSRSHAPTSDLLYKFCPSSRKTGLRKLAGFSRHAGKQVTGIRTSQAFRHCIRFAGYPPRTTLVEPDDFRCLGPERTPPWHEPLSKGGGLVAPARSECDKTISMESACRHFGRTSALHCGGCISLRYLRPQRF